MSMNYLYFSFADCGPPPVVVNASAAEYSSTLLGSTATYTCIDGFGINGSEVIGCVSSGWEAEPQCVTGDDTQCTTLNKLTCRRRISGRNYQIATAHI